MILVARFLPQKIAVPLFGDRKTYGTKPDENDSDWKAWQEEMMNIYTTLQKQGVGKIVNDAGYKILSTVALEGMTVCEIGPGSLPHRQFWNGTPKKFIAVDINEAFLEQSKNNANCPFLGIGVRPDQRTVPLADESVDLIFSFYSLEHLNPLSDYLDEYCRILKPGGRFIGAVPNEGGLAWGLGRALTSRRWVHKHTNINFDKIICWEHSNFVDTIMEELDKRLTRKKITLFPSIRFFGHNTTLLTRFIYQKAE
jgi:SAM-dependent methyltransferase